LNPRPLRTVASTLTTTPPRWHRPDSDSVTSFYQTTRCSIPLDSPLHTRRRENLKSYTVFVKPVYSANILIIPASDGFFKRAIKIRSVKEPSEVCKRHFVRQNSFLRWFLLLCDDMILLVWLS
jgi:hypothetical protein